MTRYYNIPRHKFRNFTGSFTLFVLISLSAIFLVSCKDDILNIGNDILPGEDFVSISSIDTLSKFTYTMYDNAVISSGQTLSYLGHISDTVFGSTTAEFVTQLRLGSKWSYGNNVTIDSVRFYIHVLDATGSLTTSHTLKISEIDDILYPDSVYYSNKQPALTGFAVDSIVLPPVGNIDTLLIVNLPNRFASRILKDKSQLFYDPGHIHFLPAYPDFRSYFKGVKVEMAPGTDPLLISLYLSAPVTSSTAHSSSTNYIAIYGKDSLNVDFEYDLILDSKVGNASFNTFTHNLLTASPDKRIKHVNDFYRDTVTYLQYLSGVYPRIVLPGIEKLKTSGVLGHIAVNKARITIPIQYTDTKHYISKMLPNQLVLRYKNTSGSKITVPDYLMASTSDAYHYFFDGKLDSVNKVYRFNVPQFIQAYLDGSADIAGPELEIYQGSEIKNVVFKANNSKTPVKFEFSYTKF